GRKMENRYLVSRLGGLQRNPCADASATHDNDEHRSCPSAPTGADHLPLLTCGVRHPHTSHGAYFKTWAAVLPRSNSPKSARYGTPTMIKSALDSMASSTIAVPMSRACRISVSMS